MPADKFKDKFGEEWATVLAEGRVYNALDAAAKLEVDVAELDRIWKAATPADKVVKFGGGFYCALLEPEGKDPIYTFNAFFMSMRSKHAALLAKGCSHPKRQRGRDCMCCRAHASETRMVSL